MERVKVENFQSIRKADIELGAFTVLTGPSNSGKSAFLRALRTLVANTHSASFVTKGEKHATITVYFPGGTYGSDAIRLIRGPSLSTYEIQHGSDPARKFPKSGKDVPPPIRELLNLAEIEGELINFSFQFDSPFLLAETPTKVAKVLGDLTNINVLYEAAREANRRRLDASNRLKVRQGDQESLEGRLQEFTDLPALKERMLSARARYDALVTKQQTVGGLRDLLGRLATLESAIATLEAQKESEVEVDFNGLEERWQKVIDLRDLLARIESNVTAAKLAKGDVMSLDDQITKLDEAYHEMLVGAGQCPVCGQTIRE